MMGRSSARRREKNWIDEVLQLGFIAFKKLSGDRKQHWPRIFGNQAALRCKVCSEGHRPRL